MKPMHFSSHDAEYIDSLLRHIPDNRRQGVCDDYGVIFLNESRHAANQFLKGVATEYRLAKL